MRRQHRPSAKRAELAAIAARAMVDGSARDFDDARQLALDTLRVDGPVSGPDNLAIHREMISYLDLFHHQEQSQRIRHLRECALRALALFEAFDACVCGPVWYGTALVGTPISVHLFSDETEAVSRFLLERHIDYRLDEAPFRFARGKPAHAMPCYETMLGDEHFVLSVFPQAGQFHRPLSALDDKPVRRANARALEQLLASGELFPAPATALS